MSVEINWDTLTKGPDGEVLAETIRAFVHDRFQRVQLPRLIRSVKVHSFEFGSTSPQIQLKDISDPLPDFYESDDEAGDDEAIDRGWNVGRDGQNVPKAKIDTSDPHSLGPHRVYPHTQLNDLHISSARHHNPTRGGAIVSPFLAPSVTPGFPGGTSNIGYFHQPLSAALSGTTTPLAAVAGAHFGNGRSEHHTTHQHSTSLSSLTPPSTATPSSRPTSSDDPITDRRLSSFSADVAGSPTLSQERPMQEPSPEDLQVVFHMTYTGDIKMTMTAEILLDYPMPSFVSIPVRLTLTGLTFDGVGILAYIKRKAHFCFLNPDDADALIGGDADLGDSELTERRLSGEHERAKVGGLLEEIKVESEIGQKDNGKQVLKNVGKVEKFILEQVRRIFEDESVYPSFWTFLV